MSQKLVYHSGRNSYNKRFKVSQNKSYQVKKAYINPSRFIQKARLKDQEEYVPKNLFQDLNLHPLIDRNLKNMNFNSPSPIQDQAIPYGLSDANIVGIANTGTGKTAAFAIPILHKIMVDPSSRAIILAPTRELAEQIEQHCRSIAKGSGIDGALLIGGMPMGSQLRDLRFNPRIVIGTPGRIKDHLNRTSLNLADFKIVVLDEVDRMLDMGFVNDITYILSKIGQKRQSYYFSATLDKRVRNIIERFSDQTVQISVKSGDTSDNVDQDIVRHSSHDKLDKLHDILIQESTTKTIIFDDTHHSVERLTKELNGRGFLVDSIHGGRTQQQRQRVLKRFKSNEVRVLVATDVAARGLDVADISHVINYSLPQTYDDYVHRIGRTGRAGKIGYALTFIET